jgi:hypothetical protein
MITLKKRPPLITTLDSSYFCPMWSCAMPMFFVMCCTFVGETIHTGHCVSRYLLRLSCSLYIPLLPLIFVLGTATSQSVLHSMLPATLRAKIAVESFQLQRGLSTFESLMRGVSDNKISRQSFVTSRYSAFFGRRV